MKGLTKTEQRLLARMQQWGRIGVEMAYGRGPQGGLVRDGVREYHAARSLVRKGLATVHSEWRSTIPRSGYSVQVTGLRIVLA